MLSPDGRVVMISGARRGIGRAIAETLHARGYALSLAARDAAALAAEVAAWDPGRVACHRFEALDRATHRAWVEATASRFGRIDALVNNAGANAPTTIEDDDEAALDRLWAVNVKAPLSLIRLCLPHLRQSGAGRVVNVASLSGKRVRNDRVGYAMTKFALTALTHATRRLGWREGVRATALCPGFVRTGMSADVVKIPHREMIDPGDLAELVAAVIALPNTASVAELLVNCQLEDTL